jgi:hypothetical protein
MTKKKIIEIGLVVLFCLAMSLLLIYVFEVSVENVLYICGFGVLAGFAFLVYRSYFNPPLWLFKNRYWIDGIGFGIFIAVILSFTQDADFNFAMLISALFVGVLIKGVYKYWKFNRLKKKFSENGKISIYDRGLCYDVENNKFNGWLFIENGKFCFYDEKNNTVLFKKELSEIDAKIKDDNKLNIPEGLTVEDGQIKLQIRFPLFWIQAINGNKTAVPLKV